MGTGWSQDEASQSQPQLAQAPGYTDAGHNVDDPKIKSETKSRTEGKVAEAGDGRLSMTKTRTAAEVKLPHNYEAILREADSPIDRSSTEKLHNQLCNGIFLNRKRKKYWVEKKSNGNCFTLFARDLSITWAEDSRLWHWSSVYDTSDAVVDVAELLNVCWLEIHGKFDLTKLTPGILYEVVFIIKLKDPAYGWGVPVNLRLSLPNGIKHEHKENLVTKPRDQWVEIPVGEFKTSRESVGEMEISMYEYDGGEWKRGLLIKGIGIRPKN